MTISSILPNRTNIATIGLAIGDDDQAELSPVKLPSVPSGLRMYDLPREGIIIRHPTAGAIIETPVSVAGAASLDMESLFVTILDAGGAEIGIGPAVVTLIASELAYFSAEIPFRSPTNTQPGRIQVWSESRRDGAIQHLSSLTVKLQGLDLDPLLDYLEMALASKDYEGLRDAMWDQFRVIQDDAADRALASPTEVEQFLLEYLEPGQPALNFSASPHHIIATVGDLNLIHAVYSSGWGAGGERCAWLLIGNANGRARWVGLYLLPYL